LTAGKILWVPINEIGRLDIVSENMCYLIEITIEYYYSRSLQ